MSKKTILVTGGAGYIGSHTCKALAQQGYDLVVVDNLSRGHAHLAKWGELCVLDLGDFEGLLKVFEKHRPAAVVHFAAHSTVSESVQDPGLYYWNNVRNTIHLLDAMRKMNCHQIVFSSTCATYGNPKQVPIRETEPQNPINPYGQTKLMIEKILQDYSHSYSFKAVSLRYFNASGADPEGETGECHFPETHLIPLTLEVAFGKRSELVIYGNDYPTPDGTCIRDYIHVSDLAQAHLLALQYIEKDGKSIELNLGTGKGYSVQEVINTVEKVTGKKVPVRIGARREGDPPSLFASPDLAFKTLNWKPRYTDIAAHVEHAWKWLLHQNAVS